MENVQKQNSSTATRGESRSPRGGNVACDPRLRLRQAFHACYYYKNHITEYSLEVQIEQSASAPITPSRHQVQIELSFKLTVGCTTHNKVSVNCKIITSRTTMHVRTPDHVAYTSGRGCARHEAVLEGRVAASNRKEVKFVPHCIEQNHARQGTVQPQAWNACKRYHRVPMLSPYGSVCCACAQRPGLPRACHSG